MLDMNEINREIQILENCDNTNYAVCKKLAILYTIRDHYNYNYDTTNYTKDSSMKQMPSMNNERVL